MDSVTRARTSARRRRRDEGTLQAERAVVLPVGDRPAHGRGGHQGGPTPVRLTVSDAQDIHLVPPMRWRRCGFCLLVPAMAKGLAVGLGSEAALD